MSKPISFALVVLLLITLLTGCWSRREVEELAIVTAIGIDLVEIHGMQKFRVTLQIIRPQAIGKGKQSSGPGGGGGGENQSVLVESSIGDTIEEAVLNFSTRSPRKLFLAHAKVIVVGEKAARHGMHETLDFFQRFRDFRLRNWVVVSEGDAEELLHFQPRLETMPSKELIGMFSITQPDVSKAYVVDLKNFLNAVANPGIDPVTARMLLHKGQNSQAGASGGSQGSKTESIQLLGAAVFQGDQLVGFFHDVETMGFLWVKGKVRRGSLSLMDINSKGKTREKEISIELTRAKSEIVPSLDGENIHIKVKIKAEGDLGEHMETIKITDKLPELERLYREKIKAQVQKAVKKAQSQEIQADIFGFGEAIRRKYPKEWSKLEQNWNREHFPKAKVSLEIEAKIRQTGMITESVPVR